MIFGHIVAADAVFKQLLFGNLPHTRNLLAGKHAHVITRIKQLLEETFYSIRAREGKNVEVRESVKIYGTGLPRPFGARNDVRRTIERARLDHRCFDDFGTESCQASCYSTRLFCGTRYNQTLARKRQILFPGKRLAQFHDATHNRYRRRSHIFTDDGLPRCFERCHNGTLVRGRALLDKGKRSFRVLPAFHQALGNKVHIANAHQEDERAGTLRESLEIKGEIDIPLVSRL